MRLLVYSVELWERITGKKAPKKYKGLYFDKSKVYSKEDMEWFSEMEKTIEKWNPEKHGYRIYRAKFNGNFFEETDEDEEVKL